MKQKQPKTTHLNVTVSDAVVDRIDAEADRLGLRRTDLIRRVLAEYALGLEAAKHASLAGTGGEAA